MRTALLLFVFAAAVIQLNAEEAWITVRHGFFGPVVSFPSVLRPDPNNGLGESRYTNIFRSRDGTFTVTFQNFLHVPHADRERDTLLALMRDDRAFYRGNITFQRRHGRGYTIVARRGDMKVFIQKFGSRPDANGMALRALYIEFPHTRRTEFDPWLERISASYLPFG
ncbi:MAG: hypothetical protein V4710_04310 [Verrucomicrobiota bacterium]